jgi:hypothetical protein
MAEEIVTLAWTKTTVEKFSDVQIDADVLRAILAAHAPVMSMHDMLSDRLDWLPTREQEAVLTAVVEHLTAAGHAPEGELDSAEYDGLEHDAEELSEHDTCDECGELSSDCTCCEDCGEAECVCDEDDGEDEEDDDDED